MNPGIHQVLAGAAERDAITNHALAARRVIRAAGFSSEIFADSAHISAAMRMQIHRHDAWDTFAQQGDLAILHYSIDSPAFDHALARASKSAVHYHNVTPADLLWRDLPALATQCRDGRERLGGLVGRVVQCAADSTFNAAELEALGLPRAHVVGILRQQITLPARRNNVPGHPPRILFVGRGVPNKCQHQAIMAIAALAQAGLAADLRLVGNWGGSRTYLERCRRIACMLEVENSVAILDSLSDEDLAREYAEADLFLCLSDHEGYCVPLLEAMTADLPVVAFAAGAVPETLGHAGLLLDDKSPSVVAEAMRAVLDGALANEMRAGRAEQLHFHSPMETTKRLRAFVLEFAAC